MYDVQICDRLLTLYGECPCAFEPPVIRGSTSLTVEVGEEFDPLAGVEAEDCRGRLVPVSYEE